VVAGSTISLPGRSHPLDIARHWDNLPDHMVVATSKTLGASHVGRSISINISRSLVNWATIPIEV
jgi:hypothetical protein